MVLLVALVTGIAVRAGAGVIVKPIDDGRLSELISADDNRMVLSFMAAWCGPCIDELPTLNKRHNRYKVRRLQMLLFVRQGKMVERRHGNRSEKFLD